MLRVLLKGAREKVPGFAEQLLREMFGDYISIGKKGQKKLKKSNFTETEFMEGFSPFQRSSDNAVIVNIKLVNAL